MAQELKPGKYRHYKGKFYQVLEVAHDSDTLDPYVVYRALYDTSDFGSQPLWVRKLAHFTEPIEIDGVLQSRYEWIGEN